MNHQDKNKIVKNGKLTKFLIVFGPFLFIALLCFFELKR